MAFPYDVIRLDLISYLFIGGLRLTKFENTCVRSKTPRNTKCCRHGCEGFITE